MTALRIDDDSRLPITVATRDNDRYAIFQSTSAVSLSRVEAQALIAVLGDLITEDTE
jgi:hypothetical protein